MDDLLQRSLNDGDAFGRWVTQTPALALAVLSDMRIAQNALLFSSLADCVAGRDAVARLHAVATNGGFVDTAAVFYHQYETFCRVIARMVF